MKLHVHGWGDPGAPLLVCLHGVQGHGRRFRKLAEERLAARYHVLAPDLRGHGRSTWEPPWDLPSRVADILEVVDRPATWIGHSFGARLLLEVAATVPAQVQRAALLDPALWVPPAIAVELAAEERVDKSFATVEEAIAKRIESGGLAHTPREFLEEEMREHLVQSADGRYRFRYSREAVAAAYEALVAPPPPFHHMGFPLLVVVAALSKVMSAGELELARAALGNLLDVTVVPGGHIVLWDAFDETADAIERFLAG